MKTARVLLSALPVVWLLCVGCMVFCGCEDFVDDFWDHEADRNVSFYFDFSVILRAGVDRIDAYVRIDREDDSWDLPPMSGEVRVRLLDEAGQMLEERVILDPIEDELWVESFKGLQAGQQYFIEMRAFINLEVTILDRPWDEKFVSLDGPFWTDIQRTTTTLPTAEITPEDAPSACERHSYSPDGRWHISYQNGLEMGDPIQDYLVEIKLTDLSTSSVYNYQWDEHPYSGSTLFVWSPDSSQVAFYLGYSVWLYVLDVNTIKNTPPVSKPLGAPCAVLPDTPDALAWSKDDGQIKALLGESCLRFLGAKHDTGCLVSIDPNASLPGDVSFVRWLPQAYQGFEELALSPDGSKLVYINPLDVSSWVVEDLVSGALLMLPYAASDVFHGPSESLFFSHDSRYLAALEARDVSGPGVENLSVFDLTTGRWLATTGVVGVPLFTQVSQVTWRPDHHLEVCTRDTPNLEFSLSPASSLTSSP